MAFESENLIQISAGEGSADQLGGQKLFCYESSTDELNDDPGGMLDTGYFNSLATNVRFGSYLILTYQGITGVYRVISDNPETDVVDLTLAFPNPPVPLYETLGQGPLEFVTSGTDTDVVPFAESIVGAFASYSLNSEVLDALPGLAHSGIEFVECQAGQIEIKWSRPVNAGQTVKVWLQVHTATPSP